jgi:hypothetical protein
MTTTNLFSKTSSPEIIITKIKTGEWKDVIDGLCNVKDDLIILDNAYFKHFATKETYNIIISHITTSIDNILSLHEGFTVHINMKNLTMTDIEKHLKFIQHISILFQERYSNKLVKCFVHNAPFIFSKMLTIVSMFIDKETLSKIELLKNIEVK